MEETIADLRKRLKASQRQSRIHLARAERAEGQLVAVRSSAAEEEEEEDSLVIHHDRSKWLDQKSKFAICVRRSFSHVSQRTFGATILSDLSLSTVARSEFAGAQALAKYSFEWHARNERLPWAPAEAGADGDGIDDDDGAAGLQLAAAHAPGMCFHFLLVMRRTQRCTKGPRFTP